ncbi:MAG: hypothetical protein EOO43_05620 [Flavobacterium sp.]|nr:MAG: hypothetical protein EOO43_05620 [Flavobacterium sp.]
MNWLYIILALAVVIILFLLFREIVTWYWKINEQVTNQQRTNDLLKQQNELLRANYELMKEFVDDFKNG